MLLSNFLAIFHGHHCSRRCAIDTNNDASVSLHNPLTLAKANLLWFKLNFFLLLEAGGGCNMGKFNFLMIHRTRENYFFIYNNLMRTIYANNNLLSGLGALPPVSVPCEDGAFGGGGGSSPGEKIFHSSTISS